MEEFSANYAALKAVMNPVVVGMAISPATKAFVMQTTFATPHTTFPISGFFGFNVIIDPRLSDASEVYYDEKGWRERCEEQWQWDAEKFPYKANA